MFHCKILSVWSFFFLRGNNGRTGNGLAGKPPRMGRMIGGLLMAGGAQAGRHVGCRSARVEFAEFIKKYQD